jgi:lipopolysaccharide/colanic/teichoic acid biosynthesis glycosyltransferase
VIRSLDFVISAVLILLLSPLLLCIMLILRFSGEGEIFYLQERIGLHETSFYIYKFTTMLKDSENMEGGGITRADDFRVLPLGKFLRKTKLNELPQLFNILAGHMSFVGPRPLIPEQYKNFSKTQRAIISQLKPGVTGIGSIIFRDEERIMYNSGMDYKEIHDTIITPYKGDLECWYYKNRSVFLYFKVIFITVIAVLFPKNKSTHYFRDLPEPKGKLARIFEKENVQEYSDQDGLNGDIRKG